MTHAANPPDDPEDLATFEELGVALLAALSEAIPVWVQRCVRRRWAEWEGTDLPPHLAERALEAGEVARAEVVEQVAELLAADVEAQRTNPLAIVRRAVVHPASVLAEAGAPEVRRDADARRIFPDDHYDLSPASFAEIDASLHDPGIAWGAAKAHLILARRR